MVKALRPTFNYNFGRAATTDWPRPEPMWTGPPRPHSLAPPSLTRPGARGTVPKSRRLPPIGRTYGLLAAFFP